MIQVLDVIGIKEDDLKQNAVVLAWFVYNAAMSSERVPRPTPAARHVPVPPARSTSCTARRPWAPWSGPW